MRLHRRSTSKFEPPGGAAGGMTMLPPCGNRDYTSVISSRSIVELAPPSRELHDGMVKQCTSEPLAARMARSHSPKVCATAADGHHKLLRAPTDDSLIRRCRGRGRWGADPAACERARGRAKV